MTDRQSFDTTLRCVALPVTSADIGATLQDVFSLWSDPRFAPVLKNATARPQLLLVANNAPTSDLEHARAIYDAHPELRQSFAGFTARSADLTGDMDRYERRPRSRMGAFGARAGPNFQFYTTMALAQEWGGFTLQMELDCLPVQAGWIEASQAVIDGHASAWVIGSVYAGTGELKRKTQSHLNGNALYRTGDPLFQSFLSDVWMPRLLRRIKNDDTLPYDCWWAVERDDASALEANESWRLFQTFDSFMQSDPFIVNLLCKPSDAQQHFEVADTFRKLGQMPVFFHGASMTPLRRILLDHPGCSIRDGMDAVTGQRGTRMRTVDFAVRPAPLPEAHNTGWLDRLGPGETLLRASAAQMLAMADADVASRPDVCRTRAMLGDNSATVRYFDRVTAFILGRSGGSMPSKD